MSEIQELTEFLKILTAETNRKFAETDRELKELGRYIKELSRNINGIADSNGLSAEQFFLPRSKIRPRSTA